MNNRQDRTFLSAQLMKAFKPKCPVLSIVHAMYITHKSFIIIVIRETYVGGNHEGDHELNLA